MATDGALREEGSARGSMRQIVLRGSAEQRGLCHGETYRDEIRRYAEDRVALSANGSWSGRQVDRQQVLDLAESMLPAHEAYSSDLTREMIAMAEACDLTPAEAIIVGGFTDFVDTVRSLGATPPEEDDCTAVLVPDQMAEGCGFLAQTWDMHDSATEHVTLLDVRPDDGPRSLVFSTVGCLGQIGINEAGIAVGINNLTARMGTRGVTWPLVVRQVLAQTDIEAALQCIVNARLAGAHHYLLMDAEGRGVDVEAMPQGHAIRELGEQPLVHTNHCLDAGAQNHEADKAAALMASSKARLERARVLLDRPQVNLDNLMALTRDSEAICQKSRPPFHIESSGAAIMRPATRELWAVWGVPSENEFEHFECAA